MSEPREPGGLRLLSLGACPNSHSILGSFSFARSDGGGIRGLSELLILKEIMERIGTQERREETPLPCDYFDLIGGTSTGGLVLVVMSSCPVNLSLSSLIALMLGRLGMSVDKAISCYGNLAQDVFSDTQTGGDGKFKAKKLEKVFKNIVKGATGQEDERMWGTPPDGKGCKT